MNISITKLKLLKEKWKINDIVDSKISEPTKPNDFILEDEVARMLKVTLRTMYNYRKKYKIVYFKIGNRIYYSKSLFMEKMKELAFNISV